MRFFGYIIALFCVLGVSAQNTTWKEVRHSKDIDWFMTQKAKDVLDSILCYQLDNGGWPKNQDWVNGANQEEMLQCRNTGIGATIDNGATYEELMFIARFYAVNKKNNKEDGLDKIKEAYIKGVQYLLDAQYDNGGWPQFYPQKKAKNGMHYSSHITFNDCAMVNVLRFLKKIIDGNGDYALLTLNEEDYQKVIDAFGKGIECILKCQIIKDGKPTVWCQQHDENTLLPASARAYELAAFNAAGETADILLFLMELDNPSQDIVLAIKAGIEWLEQHKMENVILESFINKEGKIDRRLVEKIGTRPLWARYYDLQEELPFYCDRDGIPKRNLDEIGYERRNGYSWINDSPQKTIDFYYKSWKYK